MTMGKDADSPTHDSDDGGENDATVAAKEKFLGALSEMMDESSESEVETKKPRRKKLSGRRGRQKTRSAVSDTTPSSFVMKLFDRSVDLTQFGPTTPLYPICRAWFQNNPKDFIKRPTYKKRDDKLTPRDVTYLPQPDDDPIPVPRPTFKPENESCPIMKGESLGKTDLLGDLRSRWLKARARAKENHAQRCARYSESFEILRRIREEAYVLNS